MPFARLKVKIGNSKSTIISRSPQNIGIKSQVSLYDQVAPGQALSPLAISQRQGYMISFAHPQPTGKAPTKIFSSYISKVTLSNSKY